MGSHHRQRCAAAALAAVVISAVSGCGGESESQLLASAKTYLEKKDDKAAILQLKSALQKNAQSGEARYLLGRALLDSGDATAATVELEKAHDLKYRDDDVLPALAEALMATGKAKKVTDLYAGVTLASPKAAAELYATVASAYIAQGQVERCQAAVNAALKSDPKNVVARQHQARLIAGRGAYEEALSLVEGVIADSPKRADALHLKGELLWIGKSDIEGGIKAFREALAADPRFLPAHLTLIRLYLLKGDVASFKTQVAALSKAFPNHPQARFYETQLALLDRDFKRAREGVQKLLRAAPNNALVLQLAGAVESQSGAPVVAQTYLEQALQLSPKLPLARRLLAETYSRAGDPAKALNVVQPLLDQPKPAAEDLALAAEAYLQKGDLAKAETFFTRAAKVNPDDPKVRAAIALTQIAKGNADVGFGQLETLAAADPGTYADLALISARMRRNEIDAALKAVDRLQGKLADKPLPHVLRGQLLAQRKDLAGARASFEKALVIDPALYPAVAGLAALDVAEKKPQEALKRFEALLAREPKNFRALLAVAELRQRAGAKPEDIGALLADAVKLNPGDPEPRLLLIDHHLARRNTKAALAAAQDGAAALPDDPQVLDALGRAQLASGEAQQAISTFGKLAAARPSLPLPHLRLGEAYASKKDYPAAKRSLQRALEVSPGLLIAQRGLVQIALAEKRIDDALAVARSVQKQRAGEGVGFVMESEIQRSQGNGSAAIALLRTALDKEPATTLAIPLHAQYVTAGRQSDADALAASWLKTHPRDAEFLFHLGSLALTRDDYPRAESRFREVLALVPDHVGANNNVAWVLMKEGKPGYLAFAERAGQIAPADASILDTLAAARAGEKQWVRALEAQRKAIELAPAAPGYRLNLAKLLIASGDAAAAKIELRNLAAMGDKFAAQSEVARLLRGL